MTEGSRGRKDVSLDALSLEASPSPPNVRCSVGAGLRRVPSGSIAIPASPRDAGESADERPLLVGPTSLLPQPSVAVEEREGRLTPDDFELLSLVGQGAFGKVRTVASGRTSPRALR